MSRIKVLAMMAVAFLLVTGSVPVHAQGRWWPMAQGSR